jgi:DNA-directed RNA polymerase subunit M/transcription elongation factor TFIIS
LSERPWILKDGKPRCRSCGSLLKPVDDPVSLKCVSCGAVYPLTEDDLKALMFDLMD